MTQRTYPRLDLATEQLEMALSLFLEQRSYASAITLAGAAEEILGKELVRQGRQSVLDWKIDQMGLFHELLHGKNFDRKKVVAEENRVRDALKHFSETSDSNVTVDLQDAACWLLVRACENSRRLNLTVSRIDEFENWFYEHVVGV